MKARSPAVPYRSSRRSASPLPALVATLALAGALAPLVGCSAPRAAAGAGAGRPTAFVANMMHGTVTVLDPATREVLAEVTMPRVGARLPFPAFVAPLPDGSKVYVSNLNSESVVAIDVAARTAGERIDLHQVPQGLAVTPDGTLLFVANDGPAAVIETGSDEVVSRVDLGGPSVGVAMAPDGTQAWFSTANGVVVVDVGSRAVVARLPDVGSAAGLVFAPDGKTVYVLGNFDPRGRVWVVDAASRALRSTITVDSSPVSAAVTPDGRWLYVVNRGANTVSVIDTDSHEVVRHVEVGIVPVGVAIDPDGAAVYVTDSMANSLSVISATSQTLVATVPLPPPPQARPTGIAIVRIP